MKLVELHPAWLGDNRHAIVFDCPVHIGGECDRQRIWVPFEPPLDPGPLAQSPIHWARSGDSFDTLTLAPSIRYRDSDENGQLREHWHGFVTNGEVTNA